MRSSTTSYNNKIKYQKYILLYVLKKIFQSIEMQVLTMVLFIEEVHSVCNIT